MCQTVCIIPMQCLTVSILFWPELYTRANTDNDKDFGDKTRRVQEGMGVGVGGGAIFYSIYRANI